MNHKLTKNDNNSLFKIKSPQELKKYSVQTQI